MPKTVLPHPIQKPDVKFWAGVADEDLNNQPEVWYQMAKAFAELWKLGSNEEKRIQGERIALACDTHIADRNSIIPIPGW